MLKLMCRLALLFLAFEAAALAQISPGGFVAFVSVDPTGGCNAVYITQNVTTGVLSGCVNGTWQAIGGGGGGGGSPNCVIAFTAQTTVNVTAGASCNGTSTHPFTTKGIIVDAYDNSTPAAQLAASVTVNAGTFAVAVTFQTMETGFLVINGSGGGGASPAFSAITSGTNTAAAMVVGSGATLAATGTGTISANQVNGAVAPTSAVAVATNSSKQFIAATVQGNGAKVQLSTGTTTTSDCVQFDANGNTVDSGAACNSGGSPAFSSLTSGTNTAMAALVGSGASLGPTGTGTVSANQVNGAVAPLSATVVATNASRQLVAATVQGNGAKVQLSTGTATSGDCVQYDANGNATDAGAPCGGGSGTFNALTGDATSTATGGATTVKGINGTLLSGLATGILKNTTTTGVPSIAGSADLPTITLTGDTTGSGSGGSVATSTVKVNGASIPASAALTATNGSSQFTAVTTIPTSTVPAFTGDMTNTAGSLATTVGKVNGGAIPASKAFMGTNGSSQLVQTVFHHPIGFGWGVKGGATLTTSSVGYYAVPFACTITRWDATVDTGTITFDVWKIATGTAIPTVTNTIVASAAPAIASNTAANSSTLTGWTTAVTAGDIFGFNISALTGSPTTASLILTCDQ